MGQILTILQNINKFINNVFIFLLLTFFYIFIIGLGKVLRVILTKQKPQSKTYWLMSKHKKVDLNSAY